jgi:hypothetical protein
MSNILDIFSISLQNRLKMIIHTVPRFWEQRLYTHFTNHGPEHSERVLNQKIAQLAQGLPLENRLTEDEIFIISAAAWLYEIGMQSPNLQPVLDFAYDPGVPLTTEQLLKIRDHRHLLTRQLIADSIRPNYTGPRISLGLSNELDDYTRAIAEVCRWCSQEPLEEVDKSIPVSGILVRLRLLVALLRLADQLYIDSARVNREQLLAFHLPPQVEARWWAYHYTQILPINKGKIRFYYSLPIGQRQFLGHIRALIEPTFDYENNPLIRYLDEEHDLSLSVQQQPQVRLDQQEGFLQEMPWQMVAFLRSHLEPIKSGKDNVEIIGFGEGKPRFHRLSKVFVTSGFPEITFVEREDFIFLKLALEQAGRGIVIEGPSGVGKTTAVEKAIEDLEETKSASPIAIQRRLSARNPADRDALRKLREWHDGMVIIDDFHRLDPTLRNEIVDYLKELADTGSKTKKVVIVGIPRTGQSLIDTYYDIATRLDVFTFGQVKDELILEMIEKGEKALNIIFDRKAGIVAVAQGSLSLAQFICYNLCAMAGIMQTQDQMRVISCDIEAAIKRVMEVLERKFDDPIMHFIAMGGPRDLASLQLLEVLATTEDGFLSLSQLQEKRVDLADGIKRFIDEIWMEKLYVKCPACTNLFYFDQLRKALVIDDPQLAFYLKQVRFSTLAKKNGKVSTLAQRRVFISYSHKDAHWLERLQIHLKPIEREGIIDLWDDTKIAAGVQWKVAIMGALATARVAVLLISANFLASDFIAEHELPTLLKRAQTEGTTIIPIILSPSLFSSTNLGAFQAINAPNQPVSGMAYTRQEQVFAKVAQTIMKRFRAE